MNPDVLHNSCAVPTESFVVVTSWRCTYPGCSKTYRRPQDVGRHCHARHAPWYRDLGSGCKLSLCCEQVGEEPMPPAMTAEAEPKAMAEEKPQEAMAKPQKRGAPPKKAPSRGKKARGQENVSLQIDAKLPSQLSNPPPPPLLPPQPPSQLPPQPPPLPAWATVGAMVIVLGWNGTVKSQVGDGYLMIDCNGR